MVSYDSMLCTLCGDAVYEEFFGGLSSSPHEVRGAEQPPVSMAASFSAEVFKSSHHWLVVLLAALDQFEDQATNRLLVSMLEEYKDSGTTPIKKDVKKTPAKCYHQL